MTRRIGLYVGRENALKVIAPLVEYILNVLPEKWEPVILYPTQNQKHKVRPSRTIFRKLFGNAIRLFGFQGFEDLLEIIRREHCDALVNLNFHIAEISPEEMKKFVEVCHSVGTKTVALPYPFDVENMAVASPQRLIESWDLLCVLGPHSKRYIEHGLSRVSPGLARSILDRVFATGYPELDQLAGYDPGLIRDKYNLPGEKPIICVSTAPLYSNTRLGYGLRARFEGWNGFKPRRLTSRMSSFVRYPFLLKYKDYLAALRDLAGRNGAHLVAKYRDKHDDPDYLDQYFEELIGDVSFFPFTTLELLSVSEVYLGFYSHMALEAVAAGNYALTALFLPCEAYAEYRDPNILSGARFLALDKGGAMNFSGASEVLNGFERSAKGRLKQLSRASLDELRLRPEKHQAWLDRFVSNFGHSCQAVMEAIESVCD